MRAFFRSKELFPHQSGPVLVFDMGGTKMRAAVCRDSVTLEEPMIVRNKEDFEEGMALAYSLGEQVLEGERPRLVVVGIAGVLGVGGTSLFYTPHLPGWEGKPILERLRDAFACPIRIENDAALAALGEAVYGAGRGHAIVAYLTVSTGVGGARIVEGQIDAKAVGFEPGHQIIREDEGEEGELERLVSGTAIGGRFGIAPRELSDKKALSDLARTLSVGVSNTILHWSPDAVIMGGSIMTGENAIPIKEVEAAVRARLSYLPRIPAFALASLGDVGGLHGGLAYGLKV